jgi:hypothetical protein
MRCAGVWTVLSTLPALLPAVAVLTSPLVDMPPVLVLAPAVLAAVALGLGIPDAALVLDEASPLIVPAGVLTAPVVFTPVPAEVPAAPVVAPALAVPPTPAAMAGTATRTAPHSNAEMQALFRVLFIDSLQGVGSGRDP